MATFNLFKNDDLFNNKQFHKRDDNLSIQKICIKNGLAAASLLIACFLGLCALTHQLEINQLSAANLFLLAFGVYFAVEDFSATGEGASVDYFEGFKVGLFTSMIAVTLHALFIGVYTSLDRSILTQISAGSFWSFNTSPLTASAITFFEGLASGLIITFCIMQYFKRN